MRESKGPGLQRLQESIGLERRLRQHAQAFTGNTARLKAGNFKLFSEARVDYGVVGTETYTILAIESET